MKQKHLVALIFLAAIITGPQTVSAGTTPEQLRALAKLPTVNLEFKLGFHSSDLRALAQTNTSKQTEAELRDLVKTEPTNVVAWCDLGAKLSFRALQEHLHVDSIDLDQIGALVQAFREGRITTTGIRDAARLMNEALDCHNKAIQINPHYLEAYAQRAVHRMIFQTCIQVLINVTEDKPVNVLSISLTPEVLADFQQIARLSPNNVETQTTFATFTMLYEAITNRISIDPSTGLGKSISEKSRALIRESCERLERLAADPDPKRAATACEGLGIIHLTLDGVNGASEKYYRRAVTLDPKRDRAWDMIAAIQLGAERNDKLLAACNERVKANDSVRSRFLLAKAYGQLKQCDNVAGQLAIILKREPQNFIATAGMAAVELQRGNDPKADDWLARADKLLTDSVSAEHRADLFSLHSVRALLGGKREGAEFYLGHALTLDPQNKNARDLLRAMEP
jgi:tetratricopeptide (TPR) repeat protein